MRSVVYVAVLLCSGMWHTQTREFKRVGTEFQTIPFEEIPLDVTQLSLVRNGLQDITFFPNFPVLRKVVLREQPRVTVFPDFENISSSLTDLTMKRCAISYILPGRLQSLVNLQVLDLTNNSLTSPFPDMDPVRGCVLHTLRLQINLLDKFPYLPEIAKTLQILTVARNFNITNAPKETMALYTKLNTLNIKPGGFLKVPDLQLLVVFHQAPHLKIDLSENAISYIDAADLRPLVAKNWTLLLKDNPIKHMGNMLHIAKGKPIDLDGTPVLCDCRMRWLKAAGERETAVSAKGLQCYGPGSVSGSLQETAYEDLVCTDRIRQSRIQVFSADSVPVPPVKKVLETRSLLKCASHCVEDSKCLIFAYNPHPGNGRCGLTDADDLASGNTGPPPGDWSAKGINWFVVDA